MSDGSYLIALAIVAHAFIGQITGPAPTKNAAGWIIGILVLVLILAARFGLLHH